jgi:hypothetical protein
MKTLFCVLFVLLQNTHQTFLQIQITEDKSSHISLRSLELDTETTFPIIEAIKIQLGEWTFWVTLFMFAGVVFMAWKENCLGKWERTGAYTVFGGLIFFSYYTIPFIIGLGIYCFRGYFFHSLNSSTIKGFTDNGTEMSERLIPKNTFSKNQKQSSNQTNQVIEKSTIPNSRRKNNAVDTGSLSEQYGSRRSPLEEFPTKANPGKNNLLVTAFKSMFGFGKKMVTKHKKELINLSVGGTQHLVNQINPAIQLKVVDPFIEKSTNLALRDPFPDLTEEGFIQNHPFLSQKSVLTAESWDDLFNKAKENDWGKYWRPNNLQDN